MYLTEQREEVCPCGCERIWDDQTHMWLCTHCDLDEVADDSSYLIMPLESLQRAPWPPQLISRTKS